MSEMLPQSTLANLDAVVLDSETTGLDARNARIIQIGALRLVDGAIERQHVFDTLIDPGIPIPPATTAIHHITDAMVAGQPGFAAIAGQLNEFLGSRIIIGHSIAFDIAMLRREFGLAGLPWSTPRTLDLRILARLAAPSLAAYDLDRLCQWLDIEIKGRHSAMGDAVATAEAYFKLIPHLRHRNIRTLAEVEAASQRLMEMEARTSGGLIVIDTAIPEPSAALKKLDAFAYQHRVSDVMTSPATVLPGDAPLSAAVGQMIEKGLSSVFVALSGGEYGVITERDALRAMHRLGTEAPGTQLEKLANSPLLGVEEDDFVYRAIGRMDRKNIRHLAVFRNGRELVGALTPRNLLRNRASETIILGDRIASAETPDKLAACWTEVPRMVQSLVHENVGAREIASVISAEICAITNRAAELAVEAMRAQGRGEPPCSYAVLVLGSAGRGESLLAADQDNALVYEDGEPGSPIDKWFADMASLMNDYLDQAGIVLCKGGVMAKNALWRHSVRGWKELAGGWVRRQNPQDLLNVDIFFDASVVHGSLPLGQEVTSFARAQASAAPDFLNMLTELARKWRSPISMLGGFQKVDGRVDVKKFGLMPIFTASRVLALKHGVDKASTMDRLRGVAAKGAAPTQTVNDILAAHQVLLRAVLDQQLSDMKGGTPLSPLVEVEKFDKARKRELKTAFENVSLVIDLVSEGRL